VVLDEELVEGNASLHALDEDDDLVEVQAVKEREELAVLLLVKQVDVVLLEGMQRQLRVVVDVHLHRLRGTSA
jgi:endonuclease III